MCSYVATYELFHVTDDVSKLIHSYLALVSYVATYICMYIHMCISAYVCTYVSNYVELCICTAE